MFENETEADTRANRIDPVLVASGWTTVPGAKIRREFSITPGRILPGGNKAPSLSADYVLTYRDQILAVIEAKRAGLAHTTGLAQAKDYAGRLKARLCYATNGLGWYEADMSSGAEGNVVPFPTPDALWDRCFGEVSLWRDRFGEVPFEVAGGKWQLRYYQHHAINAVLEAVGQGDKRILLTLATGTGKTSIAFQIAWKLFHARWNLSGEPKRRPRVLFLADRNILADQAYNAFSAFPADAITRIDPDTIRKRGKVPKNASIFFTIFQTFMTGDGQPSYEGYAPDFFDFIIIDECHRGGANDEGNWRGILEYFAPAVQLGLTATPKRKHNADTYAYFGDPVFVYSLREGIEDGFLTPFKVRQMASTLDEYVWDGTDEIVAGEIDKDRYTEADFNTKIVIDERERSRVAEFMAQIDQRQKTLVFCATQDHALRVRDHINQIKVSTSPNYCHRVTADDGKLGEQHLRDFQDNDKIVPTILTTSQKLSTGVDARNVRNIVLMRPIRSMIEFKQIIGRGTRTYDGKDYFTIYDFVRAHEHFNDPEWDGEPLPPESDPPGPKVPKPDPTDPPAPPPEGGGEVEPKVKLEIKLADGKARKILYIGSTTYWGPDGKPMSAQEFLDRLFGDLVALVVDEDDLRRQWSDPERREHFIAVLEQRGYDADKMADMRRLIDAPDSDLFDVLAYIRFTVPPKTRSERAEAARTEGLAEADAKMKEFLLGILQAYEAHGEGELAVGKLGNFLVSRYGSVADAKAVLGDVLTIREAFIKVQRNLYRQ
ncbi:EcoAI/FtnUII family type I restriction enzme subunit R [Rhodobacter capsulatus]|jgi:type I restriction enzyme R subunit|uniref:Type I restriction-modification system RcaSBIV, R subunit n=1 Tax=Rhodobacter capsulatus (strain ATCC BAA-309 / NBRC 16581 / SB1003) TaxID=272942 RepID=D5AUN3_RHOCB|nr:type I restriction endonuclease subunit R [Rhodobacter capsulatus]ADE85672.1 type I restriction-modification system RcaSBIV, R subunit [Rhodobacter capsulatus SB 1003]ETD01696.1 restriction endonuclease subunit R [Rhodobacter capsulatus DE442]ETD76764.1 restriction endonuclease subunit R [Rhodobacter capsulatus R121]ETE53601.1 restriction endonuclease subunit R [Rhodobacter capsulatus Y262]MDS0927403.1 DEAD/DEAH box helicase family protein [Rhodobacter capsulatus]